MVVKEIKAEEKQDELLPPQPQSVFIENKALSIGVSLLMGLLFFMIELALKGNDVKSN